VACCLLTEEVVSKLWIWDNDCSPVTAEVAQSWWRKVARVVERLVTWLIGMDWVAPRAPTLEKVRLTGRSDRDRVTR